jgi:hypothetical protein
MRYSERWDDVTSGEANASLVAAHRDLGRCVVYQGVSDVRSTPNSGAKADLTQRLSHTAWAMSRQLPTLRSFWHSFDRSKMRLPQLETCARWKCIPASR